VCEPPLAPAEITKLCLDDHKPPDQRLIFSVIATTAKDLTSLHKVQASYTKRRWKWSTRSKSVYQDEAKLMVETEKNTNVSGMHLVSEPLLMKLFCAFISSAVIMKRSEEKRCHHYQCWCKPECHLTQQEILPSLHSIKNYQLSQNLITINNIKFRDTMMKPITGVKIL
jgi:hypothetical protein